MGVYNSITLADTSLISYWRLGDSVGSSTAADAIGSNTGTASNVTFGATGLVGSESTTCATFNGSSSGISVADTSALRLTGSTATIHCVCNLNVTRSGGGRYYVILSKTDGTNGWELAVYWNGTVSQLQFNTYTGGTYKQAIYSDVSNGVHTIGVVRSGTQNWLYLDGVYRSTSTASVIGSYTGSLTIGYRAASSYYTPMSLQEVAISTMGPVANGYNFAALNYALTANLVRYGAAWTTPVSVSVDTDCNTDCGDSGALAILSVLGLQNKAAILAATADVPAGDPPYAMSAILNYYGFGSVPQGTYLGSDTVTNNGASSAQATYVKNNYAYTFVANTDGVKTLRAAINSASSPITVVGIGPLALLKDFLLSGSNYNSDGISSTGLQLATNKVTRLVLMGGVYDSTSTGLAGNAEYNWYVDPSAANYVVANWPGEVVFSGFEVGNTILAGSTLSTQSAANPVYYWYNAFGYVSTGRSAWDETVVMVSFLGEQGAKFACIRGTNSVNATTGVNTFTPSTSGTHYRMLKLQPDSYYQTVLNGLYQPLSVGAFAIAGASAFSPVGQGTSAGALAIAGSSTFAPAGSSISTGALAAAGSSTFSPAGASLSIGVCSITGIATVSFVGSEIDPTTVYFAF